MATCPSLNNCLTSWVGNRTRDLPIKGPTPYPFDHPSSHYSSVIMHIGPSYNHTGHPIPDNMLYKTSIPLVSLLRHVNVRLLVTHFGGTSVTEALRLGVPMAGIGLKWDQVRINGVSCCLNRGKMASEPSTNKNRGRGYIPGHK